MLQSIYQKEIRKEVIRVLSQQFQVFLRVAECGSFTKAARRLLVTPASVMKHINTLEDRLGVTLFKRDKKGVVLTAAGRSLVQDGKKMADGRYKYAMPIGLNFIFEYLFETQFGKIGPVFRYAYLNTDGRGTTIGESLRRAPDASMTRVFRNAQAFYLGVNWYLRGDDLKVQFCYEFGQFSGAPSNAPENDLQVEDAQTFRVQIQMLF